MIREELSLAALGRGLHDITASLQAVVSRAGRDVGLCHAFVQHTSASLLIQENADPDVLADLSDWFERAVPDGDPRYRHDAEGRDDMPAHIRAALTQPALTIPIAEGRLALGTWQGVYLFEHRLGPRARQILVTIHG